MGANERKGLIHQVTSCGWRAEGVVTHFTSQCASAIHEATHGQRDANIDHRTVDLTEILGIAGVPTLLFIHPDGNCNITLLYLLNILQIYKKIEDVVIFLKTTFDSLIMLMARIIFIAIIDV